MSARARSQERFRRYPRRRGRFLALLAAMVLLLSACDWPMFRYGAGRSAFSPDTSISKDAVASRGLDLDWTATVPCCGGGLSAAVANGVVFVGSSVRPYGFAFDAVGQTSCSPTGAPRTCDPLWVDSGGGSPGSSPAVANGLVYVGTDNNATGVLVFDATGRSCPGTPKFCSAMWLAPTNGGVDSSPAVTNGVVYVDANDHRLYAFDASGPTTLWTAATEGVGSSPAVDNGVVYVASDDHKLYAFDAGGNANCSGVPKTCAPLWTATTGDQIMSSPAVAYGIVYVGSNDHKLYAFDAAGNTNCSGTPKTCAPLWTATTGDQVTSSPAYGNGVVYVGSDDHKLYAFDATGNTNCSGTPKTCGPLWTATTGDRVRSSPAFANGVIYVGSDDQKLYAFDAAGATDCAGNPRTCSPLWSFATDGAVRSSPAVANDYVYIDTDFAVDAFRLRS